MNSKSIDSCRCLVGGINTYLYIYVYITKLNPEKRCLGILIAIHEALAKEIITYIHRLNYLFCLYAYFMFSHLFSSACKNNSIFFKMRGGRKPDRCLADGQRYIYLSVSLSLSLSLYTVVLYT